jgi:hypothetical protein
MEFTPIIYKKINLVNLPHNPVNLSKSDNNSLVEHIRIFSALLFSFSNLT